MYFELLKNSMILYAYTVSQDYIHLNNTKNYPYNYKTLTDKYIEYPNFSKITRFFFVDHYSNKNV